MRVMDQGLWTLGKANYLGSLLNSKVAHKAPEWLKSIQ